ncbi:nSTAND1 domain-containing NTPase [Streptomyces sp. NPDC002521]
MAADLRTLRVKAGSPPYRELGRRAHYSAGTLSDAASGRRLPSLQVTLAYVRACDGDTEEWERRWYALAGELADQSAPDQHPTDDTPPPYVGLAAFQPEDADRFFGRETLTRQLLDKVADQRFLGVFGASGVGKSSLLRAGLIAQLRRSAADQPVIVMTPGPHPIEECAVQLSGLTGQSAAALRAELRADAANLHLRVRQALADRRDTDLVLVIDQFEEIFTVCRDAQERELFINALITATHTPTSRSRVVIGLRTDFYAHCAHYPELAGALQDGQILVGPMTTDQLRRAIAQPAVRLGYTVETSLLVALVADSAGEASVLPLLSHALLATWRRRRGNTLTLAGYQAAGGIQHALAHTAEAAYRALTGDEQALAKDLLLRLVALAGDPGDGEDTKRRISRDELPADPRVGNVLERFATARLITLDGDRIQITHEALIRCWSRLRDWLTTNRANLHLHRHLTEAADDWEALDRDPGELYRGTRLERARQLAAGNPNPLSPREQAFVNASIEAETDHHAEMRRHTRRRRLLFVMLALLMATGTAVVAMYATRGGGDNTPCWTSFDPVNPEGAPMDQYYRNCEKRERRVAAKDEEGNYQHQTTWDLQPDQVAHWHWNRTTKDHHYTTVYVTTGGSGH